MHRGNVQDFLLEQDCIHQGLDVQVSEQKGANVASFVKGVGPSSKCIRSADKISVQLLFLLYRLLNLQVC